MDKDKSQLGRLGFSEFKDLIVSLKMWQTVFRNHAKEKTGVLRAERLRDALLEVIILYFGSSLEGGTQRMDIAFYFDLCQKCQTYRKIDQKCLKNTISSRKICHYFLWVKHSEKVVDIY